ncbi:histidine phosphatase family protein [Kaarinaea lacus]
MKYLLMALLKRALRFNVTVLGCLFLLWSIAGFANEREAALWDALRSGEHIALIRHAHAPGTGDPPEFSIVDCSTQRNLSDEGRQQAQRIGDRFRENGIQSASVFSSQWCRCVDTAELLGLGLVNELPLLNSFYLDFERRQPQTQKLRDWLANQDLKKPLVLVTHQVNINALINVYTSSGEMVIVRRSESGDISVVGNIQFD